MSDPLEDTFAQLISEAIRSGTVTVPDLARRLVVLGEIACYEQLGAPSLFREIRRAELARRRVKAAYAAVSQEIATLSAGMMIMNSVATVEGQDPAYVEHKRLQRDKINALYAERALLRDAESNATASLDAALALLPGPPHVT